MTAVVVLFALVLEQVATGGPLTDGDRVALRWIAHHRVSLVADAFRWVTVLGAGWVVGPIVAAAATVLFVWRRWQLGALVATAPIATFLLTGLVKVLVARPRPSVDGRLVSVSGAAFPSGHASAAVACYITLAAVLWVTRPPGWPRIAASWGAALLSLAIGCSRVYLGVHWPSDVVGGWLLGAIVLLALAAAAHRWEGTRLGSRAAPSNGYRP